MIARLGRGLRAGIAGLGVMAAAVSPGLGQTSTRPAQTGSAESVLPRDTIALIRVSDTAKLRAAFAASQSGRLWNDPAMKPFRDKLGELLEKSSNQMKEAVGLTLGELLELPQGEVALAVLPSGNEKLPVNVAAVADVGDNTPKMAELMARLMQIAEKEGATVAVQEERGLTLNILRSKEAEEGAPPLVWAQQGTKFAFATDEELLKSLASKSGGREDSLATNENFKMVTKKLGDAPAIFFLDVAGAVELGTKVAGGAGVDAETIKAQINQLGLSGLKALGGSLEIGEGAYDMATRLFVYAPAPREGVLKLFQMPPVDLKPQPWVPAGVASYASYSIDFEALYGALGELVDQFAPGVLEQAEKALEEQEGGLRLKADLLGPLAKRISAISDFKKPVTETSQRMLIAVELDDPKAAQTTFNKILDMTGASPKKRTFQGETIYDFELPPEAAQGGLTGPLAVTIAKNHLFVSTEPTLLEQVLRGGGPTLLETPEFQAVAKHLPDRASVLGFSRPDEAVQMMVGMFGSEQFRAALDQMRAQAPADAPDFSQLFDPELLPEYEEIQKYLSPSGSFGVPDEDGVILTQFTLKKDG